MFGRKKKGVVQVIGALIGVMIALLILVQVIIPNVVKAVADANITDPATTAIMGLFGMLLAVAGVMFILKWLF